MRQATPSRGGKRYTRDVIEARATWLGRRKRVRRETRRHRANSPQVSPIPPRENTSMKRRGPTSKPSNHPRLTSQKRACETRRGITPTRSNRIKTESHGQAPSRTSKPQRRALGFIRAAATSLSGRTDNETRMEGPTPGQTSPALPCPCQTRPEAIGAARPPTDRQTEISHAATG